MPYLYIGELFKLVQTNKYVTYADIYRLATKKEDILPAFYEHWGWSNLSECRVETKNGDQIKLILPPIKNIQNKINLVKENKNERTIN